MPIAQRWPGMDTNIIAGAVLKKTGLPVIKRTLDLASLRQKVTAGNIANAQSPGYKPRHIDFAGELKKLVSREGLQGVRTHDGHIPLGQNRRGRILVTRKDTGSDGRPAVNVEEEMAALAETQIWYQLGTTLARKKFAGLRLAIRGER